MDVEIVLNDLKKRMDGAIKSLKNDFNTLRIGRASTSLVENIEAEVYGSLTPLSQCASINVPDPRTITINVWDKNNVQSIEKAITSSGLGINPQIDGNLLRLPIPELNEERRKELAKLASQYGEQSRIAIRNVRKDGMDKLKKLKNDGMSEDDYKIWIEEIQDITDKFIDNIERIVNEKQIDILKV